MQFTTPKKQKHYAKLVFLGESGAGKTTTASFVAAGLVGKGGKVGFIDTENSAFAVSEYFEKQDIQLLSNTSQPTNFQDVLTSINYLLVQEKVDCIIIDSLSWIGENLIENEVLSVVNAGLKRKGKSEKTELSYSDRSYTKNMQQQLTDLFKSSHCHFIICGRPTSSTKQVGFEVQEVPSTERNVKGFSSIKFEGDMTAFFDLTKEAQPRCTIIKHRCLDESRMLQGKSFIKPTAENFMKGLGLKKESENPVFVEIKGKLLTCKDKDFLDILADEIKSNKELSDSEMNDLRSIFASVKRNFSVDLKNE